MHALEQVVWSVGPPPGKDCRDEASAAAWGWIAAGLAERSGEGLRSASSVYRKWARG